MTPATIQEGRRNPPKLAGLLDQHRLKQDREPRHARDAWVDGACVFSTGPIRRQTPNETETETGTANAGPPRRELTGVPQVSGGGGGI